MTSDLTTTPTFLDQVRLQASRTPVTRLGWLAELRATALEAFARTGLPTPRLEAWKFTNLRGLEKAGLHPAPADAAVPVDVIPTVAADGAATHRLVFVNGRHRADLSSPGALPQGVVLEGFAAALERDPALVSQHMGKAAALDGLPMLALNTAFAHDGVLLHIPRGVAVERPIELVFLASADAGGAAWHPRLLVVAEENAQATIVEHHVGQEGAAYLSNLGSEVVVGADARLHHYKIQREGMDAHHVSTSVARLGRGATYDTFVLNLGARLARHEARSVLDGTGIECRVSGAYAVRGQQHSDITTLIDHAQPRCTSREVVKGVIDGRAKAVFQGKIIVRPDAQKTDGYQLNRALLLSDTAEIDSKPELEIYADDVKCSHGATAGELDEDQLFYLRARGLPLEVARGLLVGAFLDEAVDEIQVEEVREHFRAAIHGWMGSR